MNFKGIDVSSWQGNIDFAKVKASGIDFVMLRIGTGYRQKFNLDAKFKTYYENAKKNGLKVGTFFYSYALSVSRAREEAKEVLKAIKGLQFEYPVVFDIEDASQKNLGKSTITEMCKAWLSEVEAAGYYVSIYANPDWLKNRIDNSLLKKYDLWLAHWGVTKPSYTCGIWQTSSTGKVNGISGNVDMDISYKDYPNIIKNNGLNGFKKAETPKPVEKPVTPAKTYKMGDIINLSNKNLYASSTSTTATRKISGTYYIYDSQKIGGKYRITNRKIYCGKKPTGLFVTGWVEL